MIPTNERSARCRDLYLTTHNIKRDTHSYPRRDSKPQSQQASGRRPTPRRLGRWDRHTLLCQETFRLQLNGYGIGKEKIQKNQCGAETIFVAFGHLSDGEGLKYGF